MDWHAVAGSRAALCRKTLRVPQWRSRLTMMAITLEPLRFLVWFLFVMLSRGWQQVRQAFAVLFFMCIKCGTNVAICCEIQQLLIMTSLPM